MKKRIRVKFIKLKKIIQIYLFYYLYFFSNKLCKTNLNKIKNQVRLFGGIVRKVGRNWNNPEVEAVVVLLGFSEWKLKFIDKYFPDKKVLFINSNINYKSLEKIFLNIEHINNCEIVIWSYWDHSVENLSEFLSKKNFSIVRVEDGFLRSVELGIKHSEPLSLVFDKNDLYFNSKKISNLEELCNKHDFESDNNFNAEKVKLLIEIFKNFKLSKYNSSSVEYLPSNDNRRKVLVLGQVSKDISIKLGQASDISNQDLINLAVFQNPGCKILYKVHPDIVNELDINNQSLQVEFLYDNIELASIFKYVDIVYANTSLAGFEALIHGCKVITVGLPFYAGWGLTYDRILCDRRKRKLALEEIFYLAYIIYPNYSIRCHNNLDSCLATMISLFAQKYHRKVIANVNKKLDKKIYNILLKVLEIKAYPTEVFIIFSLLYMGQVKLNKTKLKNLLEKVYQASYDTALIFLLDIVTNVCQYDDNFYSDVLNNNEFKFDNDFSFNHVLGKISPKEYIGVIKKAQFDYTNYNYWGALNKLFSLLFSGYYDSSIFILLAKIYKQKFNFETSLFLWNFVSENFPKSAAEAISEEAKILCYLNVSPLDLYKKIILSCYYNLSNSILLIQLRQYLASPISDLNWNLSIIKAFENLSDSFTLAKSYCYLMQFKEAESIIKDSVVEPKYIANYYKMLSWCYSFQKKYQEAYDIIMVGLKKYPSVSNYTEAIRICIKNNRIEKGFELYEEAQKMNFNLSPSVKYNLHFYNRQLKKALEFYKKFSIFKKLQIIIPEKVLDINMLPCVKNKRIFLCVISGIAEEIMWSRFIPYYYDLLKDNEVIISSDPRLCSFFERNFPFAKFFPTNRKRWNFITEIAQYDKLPYFDLHIGFDNNSWMEINKSDYILGFTENLGLFFQENSDVSGKRFLSARSDLVLLWKKKLLKLFASKLLVGICWRSSLVTYDRIEYYIPLDLLKPIFEIEGVIFINLQYQYTSEEVSWLKDNFDNKVITFEELDTYNDFENTAAVIESLDLVVTALGTIQALSGGLGKKTFFMSNMYENFAKVREGTGNQDNWFDETEHVYGEHVVDNYELVNVLKEKIIALRDGTKVL